MHERDRIEMMGGRIDNPSMEEMLQRVQEFFRTSLSWSHGSHDDALARVFLFAVRKGALAWSDVGR